MPDPAKDPQQPPATEAPAQDEAEAPPAQPPDDIEARVSAMEAQEKLLLEKVGSLEGREKELVDRLARMQADFDNFRRRSREEAAQAAGRGKEQFVKALLPVLDNLDRALAHAEDAGLKLLARQLQSALADQGLLVLDPAGEAFDAKVHEAIASEAKDGVKSGTVVATAEKGYALEGRLLRPARVIVAE